MADNSNYQSAPNKTGIAASKADDHAREVIREFELLRGNRGTLEDHWQEIAERMIPSHSKNFRNKSQLITKGDKRNEFLFDSTAAIALNRFSAIMDSLLTPRNQTWHRLMVNNKQLAKDRQVKLYFEEVNQVLFKYRYAPKANFASQNQQNYKSLGAYGSGCMFIDKLYGERGLRYRNIHLGEIYFVENHQGIVDKAIRHFALTARQAFQKWGEKISDGIKTALNVDPEREFFFLHCVKPQQELDVSRLDFKSMPVSSYYISMDGQKELEEGGFGVFPYAISRYEQAPNEAYGRSPAMDVLPAVKTLNEQKKTLLKQGHRTVDPVLLAHDDGIVDSFSLKPGAINAGGVTADGRPLVHALPVGNLAVGKELMDDERSVINDAFLITLFQILTESPAMTATEVLERAKEKGILVAPTIGRQQSEYLGPMIERETDVLSQQGLLPPLPQILKDAKGEYRIEYDSPLSRAQRAEEASGLMRTIETALNVVNVTQNHEPLDYFNWDVIIPEVANIQGVPERWMQEAAAVQQIRAGRAQQMQQQQMIQAGPAAAAVMKSVMPGKAK